MNAGIDSVKLSKSIFKIGDIIKKPTKIRAGAVAAAGTIVNTGAKKSAIKNNTAVANEVNPVFPPPEFIAGTPKLESEQFGRECKLNPVCKFKIYNIETYGSKKKRIS